MNKEKTDPLKDQHQWHSIYLGLTECLKCGKVIYSFTRERDSSPCKSKEPE